MNFHIQYSNKTNLGPGIDINVTITLPKLLCELDGRYSRTLPSTAPPHRIIPGQRAMS